MRTEANGRRIEDGKKSKSRFRLRSRVPMVIRCYRNLQEDGPYDVLTRRDRCKPYNS